VKPRFVVVQTLVDYDLSVEDAVAAGAYDRDLADREHVNSVNFPSAEGEVGHGKQSVEITLVQLILDNPFSATSWLEGISTDQVLQEFREMGYRSATTIELLALGSEHPDLQRIAGIMAPGARWEEEHECLCLIGTTRERLLGSRTTDVNLTPDWWFAAVAVK